MSTTPPKTPRRAATEAGVLAATEELLAEGVHYSELNVERIAHRAGISRTAFYFYFRDRRELLMRLTGDVSDSLFEAGGRWWGGDDGAEGLRAALEEIVAIYLEHATVLRAVVEASASDPELSGFWREVIGRFVAATDAHVQAEQEAGRARAELPPEGGAFALCWMTERTLYEHHVQARGTDPVPIVDALAAVWRGAVYGR